jgi:hypothetical protein
MNAALLLLALTALVGTGPSRLDPARVDDHAQATTETPKEVVQRLANETKRLKGYTAKYHGVSKGDELTVRVVYRAPGDARLAAETKEGTMATWILNGHMFLQADLTDGPVASDFDFRAAVEDEDGFYRALEREFPMDVPGPDDLAEGTAFDLVASLKKPERSFGFQVNWFTTRHHFLLWLRPAEWADAKQEGEELVRTLSDGSVIALSTRTGFIQRMRRPDGSHLDLVEFKDSADDADFVLPSPKPGTRDVMSDVSAHKPEFVSFLRRCLIYGHLTYEKDTDSDEFKAKLTRVYVVLLTSELTVWSEGLNKNVGAYVDQFAAWSEDRFKATANDPSARKELEGVIAERRKFYADKLAAELQYHEIDKAKAEELGAKPELIAKITDIERAVHEDLAQRLGIEPFLAKFDDAIAAAKSAK